jgi:hypothetical protein
MLDFYCGYPNALATAVVLLTLGGSVDAVYQYKTDSQKSGGHRTAGTVLTISILLLLLHQCPKPAPPPPPPRRVFYVPIEQPTWLGDALPGLGCVAGVASLLLALYGRRIVHLWRVMSACRRRPWTQDQKILSKSSHS